jgi:hypothetical protein
MKYKTATLAAILLLTISVLALGSNFNSTSDHHYMIGKPCINVERTDGTSWSECVENTFVTEGTNATWERVFFVASNQFDYIAAGNGSDPTSSDTSLNGEMSTCGFSRVQETPVWLGQANVSLEHKWTSTCDNIIVNSTGIFNNSAGGTLLAATSFADQTLNNNDNLTINYTMWAVIV